MFYEQATCGRPHRQAKGTNIRSRCGCRQELRCVLLHTSRTPSSMVAISSFAPLYAPNSFVCSRTLQVGKLALSIAARPSAASARAASVVSSLSLPAHTHSLQACLDASLASWTADQQNLNNASLHHAERDDVCKLKSAAAWPNGHGICGHA